jgi:hypothetical protein
MASGISGLPVDHVVPATLASLAIAEPEIHKPPEPGVALHPSVNAGIGPLHAVAAVSMERPEAQGHPGDVLTLKGIDLSERFTTNVAAWENRSLNPDSIRELHAVIAHRAGDRPGIFRNSVTWVGGSNPSNADLVPPPPAAIPELLEDYFQFARRENISPWLRMALLHYQLLTIHPFKDGNGRIARLLAAVWGRRFGLSGLRVAAIVAALTWHNYLLADLYRQFGQGRAEAYIRYWRCLVNWIDALERASAHSWIESESALRTKPADYQWTARLVQFFGRRPIFRGDELRQHIGGSMRLRERTLSTLLFGASIEPWECSEKDVYRCPDMIRYWRHVLQLARDGSDALKKQCLIVE